MQVEVQKKVVETVEGYTLKLTPAEFTHIVLALGQTNTNTIRNVELYDLGCYSNYDISQTTDNDKLFNALRVNLPKKD